MKLTPLDIQQQQFRSSLWGFDTKEVDAFLDLVSNEFERLTRDNNSLRDQIRQRDTELEAHREREQTLKDTMLTATRLADEIRENARKEAEVVVARAETQGEQIVQNAHTRLVRVLEDVDELRRQKAQMEASLRSILESHRKLLDAMSERADEIQDETMGVVRRIDGRQTPRSESAEDRAGTAGDESKRTPR